jgi:hypothetical protein
MEYLNKEFLSFKVDSSGFEAHFESGAKYSTLPSICSMSAVGSTLTFEKRGAWGLLPEGEKGDRPLPSLNHW